MYFVLIHAEMSNMNNTTQTMSVVDQLLTNELLMEIKKRYHGY